MRDKVIALGFFDGIHLGHGELLKRAALRAKEKELKPAVFTFDLHPDTLITGDNIQLINSADDRTGLISRLYGIDNVIFSHFDKRMMKMPWENFITDMLVGDYGAAHLVAGHDFHFGYRGEGNPERLVQKCAELGLGCDIVPRVELDGITISSTYIRTLIAQGEMERAEMFLGHPHCLTNKVTRGRRIGSSIGFPTVNLAIPKHVIVPAKGVYATRLYIDGFDAPKYGVTNVGMRPTVNTDPTLVTVETNILGCDCGDLYGKTVRVEFLSHMRPERKFPSLDALKAQISEDIISVTELLKSRGYM
ncbi:MAG: riboflavin biosynthesis protein RibF [Oscillospiraceae bacterium]|nr:riboflavin biosynthesis protein RibF [Oscillospiraceae bacterium]